MGALQSNEITIQIMVNTIVPHHQICWQKYLSQNHQIESRIRDMRGWLQNDIKEE
jgi:hypothetical protein